VNHTPAGQPWRKAEPWFIVPPSNVQTLVRTLNMRICGWILTILGYLWAFSGCVRIGLFAMHGGPMAGQMILISLGTLVLAALALWGGSKLRDKADARAYALEQNR
jgi:hypothetical protein